MFPLRRVEVHSWSLPCEFPRVASWHFLIIYIQVLYESAPHLWNLCFCRTPKINWQKFLAYPSLITQKRANFPGKNPLNAFGWETDLNWFFFFCFFLRFFFLCHVPCLAQFSSVFYGDFIFICVTIVFPVTVNFIQGYKALRLR